MTSIIREPKVAATHCMIWMHGLGASNQDMAGLVDALNIKELPLRHVCLQAPQRPVSINAGMRMPAWYDIIGNKLVDREDKEGIIQSNNFIAETIKKQETQGIPTSKIFLAGFSQGGAMALYSALHHEQYLAGVVSLSSYLPLAAECLPKQRKTLPIFMGYGSMDPVVIPEWSTMSHLTLVAKGFSRIELKDYPMMHEIVPNEISDLRHWIISRIS
jgi:phospholipase/carboxylesterase